MGGSSLKRSSPAAWKRTLGRGSECRLSGDNLWSVTAVTDCHLWVRDNKAPLYREQWPGSNGVQQRFRKFLPAGEPSVLYCSAIAPLAPDEGHQETLCGYVHGSSALKENYACEARDFPSD